MANVEITACGHCLIQKSVFYFVKFDLFIFVVHDSSLGHSPFNT